MRNDTLNGPMKTHPDQNDGARNGAVVKRRSAVFLILAVVFVIAAIFVPGRGDSRVAMNEAGAIGSLRALTTLQNQYAAENPSKGFACELARLRDVTHRNGESDHEALLVSQSYGGYKFSLTGCEVGTNGVVIRYKATAIPRLPGETGVSAFCGDQTGGFWYAANGSAENCLAERRPLR
jgi:hypothetical protein